MKKTYKVFFFDSHWRGNENWNKQQQQYVLHCESENYCWMSYLRMVNTLRQSCIFKYNQDKLKLNTAKVNNRPWNLYQNYSKEKVFKKYLDWIIMGLRVGWHSGINQVITWHSLPSSYLCPQWKTSFMIVIQLHLVWTIIQLKIKLTLTSLSENESWDSCSQWKLSLVCCIKQSWSVPLFIFPDNVLNS